MLTYRDLRIAHLTFTGFTDGSGDQLRTKVRAALDAGATALILDLRGGCPENSSDLHAGVASRRPWLAVAQR
jgi:C-terminal processing protease CtpA/Prc